MKQLNAVIWDMDGVLVDTGRLHYDAWQSTLDEYSIAFDEALFRQTFGMNNETILRRLLGDRFSPALYDEISGSKEERFRAALPGNVTLFPGALPLLRALREQGVAQAIGSSAPQPNIDAIVGELGIAGYLDAIVSAAEMPGKPDPVVFLTAAALLGARPRDCVVIEDTEAGIAAAQGAGMKCVAVATTNPVEALQTADLVVDGLEAIEPSRLLALVSTP
ncbi:MAG: beta-phosphoglucomutase family hydrolase [Anaerolineae bacterium]|nr:beta-phosphoglucomutase family hydrolase [Anaerolineae bacterium]